MQQDYNPKIRYTSSTITDGVQIIEEFPDTTLQQKDPKQQNDQEHNYQQQQQQQQQPTSTVSKPRNDFLPPLPNHKETILDVNLIESPHPMIVSASRDGIVKVWK